MKRFSLIFAALFALGITTCTHAENKCAAPQPCTKDASSPVVVKNVKSPQNTILFFMNPNGHPCQMQNEIITALKDTISPLANLTYIRTTEPSDLDAFSMYGIRGLPSLIIVDKSGKEVKRFTPGIQSAQDILSALRHLNK